MLEQVLNQQTKGNLGRKTVYQIVDLKMLSSTTLYTGPVSGYDLPASGFQFHFHEGPDGFIGGGKLIDYDRKFQIPLDNYQIAMGDHYAKELGIKPIDFNR